MRMEDYSTLAYLYKSLAEQYLFELYSVRRLDERFGESDAEFLPEDGDDEASELSLRYIFLVNRAHIERLSDEEREVLEAFAKSDIEETDNQAVAELIENTYQRVLAGDPREGTVYEYYKSIHGEGILPGNSIVFGFRDKPAYTEQGALDQEKENRKTKIFSNVKAQFESLANRKSGETVFLMRM